MAEAPAEGGKKPLNEPPPPSTWDNIAAGFTFCFHRIIDFFIILYRTIKFICVTIWNAFEFVYYPIKERILMCCNRSHLDNNPHLDPGYSTFQNYASHERGGHRQADNNA